MVSAMKTDANPRAPKYKALNQEPSHITRAREWARMTKTQLANASGISLSLMSDIEHGARSATPEVLARIAEVLNCPIAMLERRRDAA